MRSIWQTIKQHRRLLLRLALWAAFVLVPVWLWAYLRPDTWRYYTDEIAFSQLARGVKPRLVLWEDARPVAGVINSNAAECAEPAISPDGATMVFTRGGKAGNSDLFFSRWDGAAWGIPEPARALNSPFHERGAAFSRDGKLLFFSTDRPGGPGGFDIWVSRWDGIEFAWPLPLTAMVNSPYDELGPAPTPDGEQLHFSSNRPRLDTRKEADTRKLDQPAEPARPVDFDLFTANAIPAGVTNREVERAISMLYYLRESALRDAAVMEKLGGRKESEAAVDRALAWLAANQEADGRWSLSRHGGSGGHDVAATSFALLSYFGRGERHDRPGKYQDTIARGLAWIKSQQSPLGKLRGTGNMYDHGIATLALGEAYGLTKDEDLYETAQDAVDYIVDNQNEQDGAWRYDEGQYPGDMSVSGWQIMALKNAQLSGLDVPERTLEGIRRWLQSVSGGKSGGIYGYQGQGGGSPAMIATGYFCSQLMGLSPNALRSFETADDIMGRAVTEADLYFAYYGTLAANQNQGGLWRKWRGEFQDKFVRLQNPDGSWNATGQHAERMGKAIVTSLVTLSLQAHYRYTPMYGLGYEPDRARASAAVFNRDQLPAMPEYRRARRRWDLSSPLADDLHPAVTLHGDFLYFASARPGGRGGLDLYRSRISGRDATRPENLGVAINSEADEFDPAPRLEGLHLLFSSNRGQQDPAACRIYGSVSRHVFRVTDRTRMPRVGWMLQAFRWRLIVALLGALLVALAVRQVRRRWRTTWRGIDGRFLPYRFLQDWWHWLPGAVSVFVIVGCLVSALVTLNNTWWCWYTDGAGIRRNALEDQVRLVLWDTHRTLGKLGAATNGVQPAFSADGTKLVMSVAGAGGTNRPQSVSTWDGRVWSQPEAVDPAVPVKLSEAPGQGGGFRYYASAEGPTHGGQDLYRCRILDGQEAKAENLGLEVNSASDDVAPCVRMEGFDLLFRSDRQAADGAGFKFYTATAREVVGRVSLARWRSFTLLIDRVKWWFLALVAAAAGLWYLARHIRDITSLFHKCLMISLAVHLVLLLLLASWVLTRELKQSMDAQTMQVAVSADALAREKLALDLESGVTALPEMAAVPAMDSKRESMEIPTSQAKAAEDVAVAVAKSGAESFFENVDTTVTQDRDKDVSKTRLDEMPKIEIAMPEIKLEVAETAPTPEAKPDEPAAVQERVEVVRQETRPPDSRTKAEKATPTEPIAPASVLKPAEIKTETAAPARMNDETRELAKLDVSGAIPSLDLPAPTPQLEVGDQAGKPDAAEEFKPAVGARRVAVEAAASRSPETRAESRVTQVADVGPTAVTGAVARVVSDGVAAAALSDVPASAPAAAGMERALPGLAAPRIDVELEMGPGQGDQVAAAPAEAFAPQAGQARVTTERVGAGQPATAAVRALSGSRDIVAQAESAVAAPGGAATAVAALAVPGSGARAEPRLARADSAGPMPNLELSIGDAQLEMPVAAVAAMGGEGQAPDVPGMVPRSFKVEKGALGMPAGSPSRAAAGSPDVTRLETDGTAGPSVPAGGLTTVAAPGLLATSGRGIGEEGVPVLAARGPNQEFRINAPGQLEVPKEFGTGLVPDVMKNPAKLSTEIIEGLGGSGDTQGSISRALDWFSANQERNGSWSLDRHGGGGGHDVGGTALVLLCYYGWGAKHTEAGQHQDVVKRAIMWLRAQQLENGDLRGWLLRRYEDDHLMGNMYDHAIATIALSEAYALSGDKALLEPATRAVRFLVDAQEKELGGWRYKPGEDSDTSVLGWAYMALTSAKMSGIEVPPATLERANAWLARVASGGDKGLYGYQDTKANRPAMVATGMFCRQLAGIPPTDPRMYESAGYMAMHPIRAEEVDYYYLYYGTLALYQNQGATWEQWNDSMKQILVAQQRKTGREAGTWDPTMWYADTMGRVVTTALSTLSLEVYYRILPIYGFTAKQP